MKSELIPLTAVSATNMIVMVDRRENNRVVLKLHYN